MMALRWMQLTPTHLHLLPLIKVGHVLREALGYSLPSFLKTALWERRNWSVWLTGTVKAASHAPQSNADARFSLMRNMLSVCKCIYFSLFCHLCELNYYFYLGNPHYCSSLEKLIVLTSVFHSRKILYFEAFFFNWTKCSFDPTFSLFTFCSILSQWTWKALWICLPGYPFCNIVLWFHIFHIRTWHLTHVVAVISLTVTSNVIDIKMILWQFWAFIGSENPCESQFNHDFDLRTDQNIGEEVSERWFSSRSSLQNWTKVLCDWYIITAQTYYVF